MCFDLTVLVRPSISEALADASRRDLGALVIVITKNRARVENEGVSVNWPPRMPMPVFHDVSRAPDPK